MNKDFSFSRALLIVLACIGLLGTEALAENLYKVVDPDGKITYSNRAPTEGRIEKTLTFDNLPSSKVPSPNTASKPTTPVVAPSSGVLLYAADWCGYCKKAKAYLASKNISYQEINIDTTDGNNAFAQVSGGQGIPLLFSDGKRVQGFSLEAYDDVFAGK